jgi:hypothetical protein
MRWISTFAGLSWLALVGFSQEIPKHANSAAPTKKTIVPAKTAQQKKADARKKLALDLLKQSHALNDQLDDGEVAAVLRDQVKYAMLLDQELGKQWALELFDRASKSESDFELHTQLDAIENLSRRYPEDALALLEQIDPRILAPDSQEYLGTHFDVDEAERQVYLHLIRRKGKSVYSAILQSAAILGDKGRYPYWPVMSAALQIGDPALGENTAKLLLTRFQQRVDEPSSESEFSMMLRYSQPPWPHDLMKAALEADVDVLEHYPVTSEDTTFILTVSGDGKTVSARGPLEIGLLRLVPLMKRDDPELLQKLTKAYSFLAGVPADMTPGAANVKWKLSSDLSGSKVKRDKTFALNELKRRIMDDPDKAEQTISLVSDPELRAQALTFASSYFTGTDLSRAAKLAAEAEKAANLSDNSFSKFQALCATLTSDAVNHRNAQVIAELEIAFQTADKLMRKAVDNDEPTFEIQRSLWNAVHETIKLEPELTVAHINSIYLPDVRSELLLAAVEALLPNYASD